MGQPEEVMTERIIKAMHNPNVHIIGHPTCRLIGEREPVQMDVEAILQAARDTGTALEIDAQPGRLDLKDKHIHRARELGVKLVIDSDSHATEQFGNLGLGVSMAKRGWCEAKDILNTLPMREFRAALKRRSGDCEGWMTSKESGKVVTEGMQEEVSWESGMSEEGTQAASASIAHLRESIEEGNHWYRGAPGSHRAMGRSGRDVPG